jgi:hypothetical protein
LAAAKLRDHSSTHVLASRTLNTKTSRFVSISLGTASLTREYPLAYPPSELEAVKETVMSKIKSIKWIFVGANQIRTGWRALLFIMCWIPGTALTHKSLLLTVVRVTLEANS